MQVQSVFQHSHAFILASWAAVCPVVLQLEIVVISKKNNLKIVTHCLDKSAAVYKAYLIGTGNWNNK